MMFNQKFVAALKVDGKVLREVRDTVYVPFGSQYSILLKNLNSVRALVNIQIDGQEVCPTGLVLDANKEVDLERFIKNGNLTAGNKFKFIERTAGVEAHRGIRADDGIIRISFRYEKPRPAFVAPPSYPQWPGSSPWPGYYPPGSRDFLNTTGTPRMRNDWINTTSIGSTVDSDAVPMKSATGNSIRSAQGTTMNATFGATSVGSAQSYSAPVNDAGITVPGSVSNQTFTTTTMGAMEAEEHVIVFRLLGETLDGTPVSVPLSVKAKPVCSTCGRTNKATARFCSSCGTSLILV